jgi:hypothetical protein
VPLDPRADVGKRAQLRVVERVAGTRHDRVRGEVDDVMIGIRGARHEALPQPADRVDGGAMTAAGDRIGGEQDPREARAHEPLHDDRERESTRAHLVRLAVRDRALVPQRRPAAPHGVDDRVLALDPEDGVLLAGEARLGQVLGRRR